MNDLNTLKPLYPGAFPQNDTDESDARYPKAPLNLTLGFDLDELMPSKKVPDVGLIEPLSVIKPDPDATGFLLLDGNLRMLALKELGQDTVPCLITKDFETYTYNHRINRLSTVQEHYILRRAIDKGVSKERLARAFNVNLSTINSRINLLHGICPKAVELLQDHQFTPDVTRHLRKMKAARQIEAIELMIAANTITAAHADALLKPTPPEQRTDYKPPQPEQPKGDPLEQIVKLEREMSQVQEKYKHAEENYGSELPNLVVAQGYLQKADGERGRSVLRGAACVRDPRAVRTGTEYGQHGRGCGTGREPGRTERDRVGRASPTGAKWRRCNVRPEHGRTTRVIGPARDELPKFLPK